MGTLSACLDQRYGIVRLILNKVVNWVTSQETRRDFCCQSHCYASGLIEMKARGPVLPSVGLSLPTRCNGTVQSCTECNAFSSQRAKADRPKRRQEARKESKILWFQIQRVSEAHFSPSCSMPSLPVRSSAAMMP